MEINGISTIGFKGLWEPVKKMSKESGTYNRDKVIYTLYDTVYHPFVGESNDAVNMAIKKGFVGRSFSLWDKFDGQNKADMFQMNLIKLGEPISEHEADIFIGKGFKKELTEGVLDENAFIEAYSNNTYEPYDINRLSQEEIKDIANRHFDIRF